ncbi:MmgE/PrpD family protein [uncultured Sulfitobacter sp.]|uniref:MmgE/PrpD family protein n=1 Tax=uncultured Sulfitobacter sp. TaxID=191468 RepID=UPI002630CF2A|nr:MmgE/PrpD family protein [uncultured Sulfitobacter sp.]
MADTSHPPKIAAATDASGFTRAAADWIAGSAALDMPEPVLRLAGQCLFDWFAVTIAATDEELVPIITAIGTEGETVAQGGTLVGQGGRATEQRAALINGTLGHALDFDDVNLRMHGHPTVPIAPALLAVAEREGLSGIAVLRAFVVGYQIAGRLGHAMGDSHYARGFHATGTIGAVAAAAGCAALLKLDADRTEAALGLAATQASGIKAMFGTMAKPFHAGNAAANGVMAVRLAQQGFTAREGGLEHAQGFGAAMSDDAQMSAADFGATPDGAPDWEITRNLFKYHAACYLTHSTIEAMARLPAQHAIDPNEVTGIALHVPDSHRSVCDVAEPRTGLDIKFSIRHLAALALTGADTADLSLYSEATACDATLSELSGKTRLVTDEAEAAERYGAKVDVTLTDGTVRSATWDVSTPVEDLDAQEETLRAKAVTLIDPKLGAGAADSLLSAIRALPAAADLSQLLHASTPARGDLAKIG